jgi:hypothetical protein
MIRLQDRAEVWWTLALCAALAQGLDIVTTLALLGAGGGEANGLAAFLMREGGWWLLIGSKLALAAALVGVLVAFAATPRARHSAAGGVALVAVALLVLASWLIIGNNLADWLILAHALPWR